MDQTQNKPWWASKAVIGGLVALLAGIAGIFGVTLGADVQAELADYVVAIASAIGGLVAIYGRVRAEKKIGKAE